MPADQGFDLDTTPPQRWFGPAKLGTLLAAALWLPAFALVGVSAGLHAWGAKAIEERRIASDALEGARSAVREHLMAMVDEEVGLRGYLATGEERFLDPYHGGRRAEAIALRRLGTLVGNLGSRVSSGNLDTLAETARAWHDLIADQQIIQRRSRPLPDLRGSFSAGKVIFDDVRLISARLQASIETDAASFVDDRSRLASRLELANWTSLSLLLLSLAAAGAWLRRRIVHPLASLALAAEQGNDLAGVDSGGQFRELGTLTSSLRRAQQRILDREARLASQGAEAEALRAYFEVLQQLSEEGEVHDLLARALRDRLELAGVNVLVMSNGENRMEVALPALPAASTSLFPILNEPMRCRAVRTSGTVALADAGAPTACRCELGVPAEGSYLCMPLLATGHVIGLVNLQSSQRGYFTSERQRVAQAYAGPTATALSSIRLLKLARDRALRDGLTGVYNRRFLAEFLPRQILLGARAGQPLSALMIDIDHFKSFNDTYGHEAGDRVLVAFVRALQTQIRASDVLVRYGGEEFLVLLPDTATEGAALVAERMRAAVEALPLGSIGLPRGVAIRTSIGVASLPESAIDEETLLRAADGALFRAKGEGRNRVVVAERADGLRAPESEPRRLPPRLRTI